MLTNLRNFHPICSSSSPIISFIIQCRPFHPSAHQKHGIYPYFNKHKPVTDPKRQDPDYFEKEAEKVPLSKQKILIFIYNYLCRFALYWWIETNLGGENWQRKGIDIQSTGSIDWHSKCSIIGGIWTAKIGFEQTTAGLGRNWRVGGSTTGSEENLQSWTWE